MRWKRTTAKHMGTAFATTAGCLVGHWLLRPIYGDVDFDRDGAVGVVFVAVFAYCLPTLLALSVCSRRYRTRTEAATGAAVSSVTLLGVSLAADWWAAGWRRAVGHDVWFGDREFWILVGVWGAVLLIASAVVAVMSCSAHESHGRMTDDPTL